jgi:hypothetical protein
MLRIFHLLLFVAFVIGGGASSPYTLAYKASLFFPAIEYQNTGVAPLVTFNTTVEKDGVSKEGKLSYHPFQPVYFVTEKDKSIVTPAADIPAIMVAGIIQTKEFEQNFKRVSLSLDAVLTVSAIGNVAKLKYLKDFASAARLTLAGIELSSTALDLLLNYTDLCVDGELCEALREYNFYLQVGLLSGEALSAIYKSQLKALKLKAAEKYAEKRAKLVAKYGENSKEVKALDEHFGVLAKGADDIVGTYTTTIKWGSKTVEARPFRNGYWGKRFSQSNPRVDAYELKINPNNESYYLPLSEERMVQFENISKESLQDGKLIIEKSSIYHVYDKPPVLRTNILNEAKDQAAVAKKYGLKVEWLVSDEKAVDHLTRFFKEENVEIIVKLFPE